MAKTNYLEDAILNFFLRNDADTFTPPATVYVALFTAVADAEAGTATEVTGGGYARQSVTFDDPAGAGTTQNAGLIQFPQASSDLGTVTHFGLCDASSGGNIMYIDTLDASFDYNTNVQPEFAAGQLTVTED